MWCVGLDASHAPEVPRLWCSECGDAWDIRDGCPQDLSSPSRAVGVQSTRGDAGIYAQGGSDRKPPAGTRSIHMALK